MANKGQTNLTPELHRDSWRIRPRINGKQVSIRLCKASALDGMTKVQRAEQLNRLTQQALAKVNAGENPAPVEKVEPGPGLTVKCAGDSWLHWSQTRRRNPIGRNTLKGYANTLAKIYDVIGTLPLSELKSMQAKKVIDAMVASGCSSKVIDGAVMLMQQILAHPKDVDGQPLYTRELDRDVMDVPKVEKAESKAFTAEQIEQTGERTRKYGEQYEVLTYLLASTGARIGEALAIEIDADPETKTTLSKDCRVLYVQSNIHQDGFRAHRPKTNASIREVDIHPDIAALLKDLTDLRTSGYLFCTESGNPILYSNLVKNVFDPVWWDREQPIMKREGKGWKKVGVKTIPGVIGRKADYQDKEQGRTGYGMHSFRRFRETYLHLEGVPERVVDFWTGHGPETMGELYTKIKSEIAKRREWCEKAGLGFKLPVTSTNVTEIKTAGKTAKKGKAA